MTQKELKAIYTEELKKVWDDEKMVKHCARGTAYIIEHGGKLYGVGKPKIKKVFCFGCGMFGRATEDEVSDAEDMAKTARTSEDYFKAANLKDLNEEIKELEKIRETMTWNWVEGDHPRYMIGTGAHYYSQSEDCILNYWTVVDTFNGREFEGEICNDVEFLDKLIEAHEAVKKDFEKQIERYLKRYGLKAVRSWSYISD